MYISMQIMVFQNPPWSTPWTTRWTPFHRYSQEIEIYFDRLDRHGWVIVYLYIILYYIFIYIIYLLFNWGFQPFHLCQSHGKDPAKNRLLDRSTRGPAPLHPASARSDPLAAHRSGAPRGSWAASTDFKESMKIVSPWDTRSGYVKMFIENVRVEMVSCPI